MSGDHVRPLLTRAEMLLGQNRVTEAEGYARQALAQQPEHAGALAMLAFCLYRQDGRNHEALRAIEQAIAAEPNESTHHAMKALVLLDGRYPLAAPLASAEESVKLDPDSAFARRVLAMIHLARDTPERAEAVAREALAIDPDDTDAAELLARILMLRGRATGELRSLGATLLRRDPDSPESHALAGWMAIEDSDRQKAEDHFLTALRRDPLHEQARCGLLESFRQRSPVYAAVMRLRRGRLFEPLAWPAAGWAAAVGVAIVFPLLLLLLAGGEITGGRYLLAMTLTVVIGAFLGSLFMGGVIAVASLLLWRDPIGRHALSSQEKMALVTGLVVAGVFAVIIVVKLVTGW